MNARSAFHRTMKLMGNRFQLTAVDASEKKATAALDAAILEIQQIEQRLTTFSDTSETAEINRQAGIRAVSVSRETFELIERSLRLSSITQGAFDITYGSTATSFWNFDTSMQQLPDERSTREKIRLVNYRNVLLHKPNFSVLLKEPGMRIGFGGIGKGYAAERSKAVMVAYGIDSGIVNAAGDLAIWGRQPDGKPWTIGIADPNQQHSLFSYFRVSDLAVATSGNYEKFVLINGKKHSHTINPKTGRPVQGIKSVTILSPNAEIADAMATPVMIMGIRAGLDMVNQIHLLEAIVVDDQDRVYTTKNIHLNTHKN